jgi:hypothetical protein
LLDNFAGNPWELPMWDVKNIKKNMHSLEI